MRRKKSKKFLGVISIFLWALVLTMVLHAYFQQGGELTKVVELALTVLTVVGFIACTVIYVIPTRRLAVQLTRQLFSIS